MADYVERHDGALEEINGARYFTTTVTVDIDGVSQDIKVKLLEQAETGEMIPSYNTVEELLGANNSRVVLELSRMENAEDALFVVRSGENLQADILRADAVIQGFVDRVNAERGDNVWPEFGMWAGQSDAEEMEELSPNPIYNVALSVNQEAVSKDVSGYGIDIRKARALLVAGVVGTDQIIGLCPTAQDGIVNLGID